jgi:cell division protease FtsH
VANQGSTLTVLEAAKADVGRTRERGRQRRLLRVAVLLGVPTLFLWYRLAERDPFNVLAMPNIPFNVLIYIVFFGVLMGAALAPMLIGGRSPHITYRPEQIDVGLNDVVGIEPVKEDVIRSLNLFLAHKQFRDDMGGTPRRGLLFEGAPGTGKTHLAKAMAREAGVPFLFVSGTSFQSMYYGATARKIRSYFKALRKAARTEGGAIGFIEEIDAIAMARGGVSATPMPDALRMQFGQMVSCCGGLVGLPSEYAGGSTYGAGSRGTAVNQTVINRNVVSEGVGGVVNEMLVQMQSFDSPTGMQKARSWAVDKINPLLPATHQLKKPMPVPTNVLLIAATNRADNLDPALLRPGRFDRRLTFESPDKVGRRELIDFFLARKAHHLELDDTEQRDQLAAVTQGYTPVMIEHLFDEGLVNALRRADQKMNRKDVEQARLVEEVGMGQPVGYTPYEERLIATHEAGHATMAWLVAPYRRLEVLTIVKRRSALGMLAHGDMEDVYTRSRSELVHLMQIAMGGQCAEEIFFGDVSTGPGGDLLYATNVAAQMVGATGMTDTLISMGAVQGSAFNDTNLVGRVLADPDGRRRVEDLLQQQKGVASALLTANRHLVEALRDALIDRHELVGREINDVLEAARDAHGGVADITPEPLPQAAAADVIDLRDTQGSAAPLG